MGGREGFLTWLKDKFNKFGEPQTDIIFRRERLFFAVHHYVIYVI